MYCYAIYAVFLIFIKLENVLKVTLIQRMLLYNINIHPIVYIIDKRGAYFERIQISMSI